MKESELERSLGYVFKDKALLKRALTLSSYNPHCNNESMECLGDALLTFIVCEKYYGKNLTEGEITLKKQQNLSDEALRPVAEKLGLDKNLLFGKGDTHNKKAVPSAYEAMTAAIYLDGGLEAARSFVLRTLDECGPVNYIGALQEYVQSIGEELPTYTMTEIGDIHSPEFKIELSVCGRKFFGTGSNIAVAKRTAARLACAHFGISGKM